MDEKIILSVVIVVYNHEKYLEDAIKSVLTQKCHFKYEIIISDDASTDDSETIISKYKQLYPDLIKLNMQVINIGATKNIYDAISICKGKYVALLEGDDFWISKNKINTSVNFLENNKEYVGVSHRIKPVGINGMATSEDIEENTIDYDANLEEFIKGKYFSAVSTVFNKEILFEKNDFRIYYKAHNYVGDLTMCLLLLNSGKVRVLGEQMSAYRYRNTEGESNYNSIRKMFEKYEDHMYLLKNLDEYFKGSINLSQQFLIRTSEIVVYYLKRLNLIGVYNSYKILPLKYKIRFIFYFPNYILSKLINSFREY